MANILRVPFDSKIMWPIKQVTVYEGRAHVTRILEYKATDHGEVELKLENLPVSLMHESVRAEVESQNATVLEVGHNDVNIPPAAVEITDREKEIAAEIDKLTEETTLLAERLQWIKQYAGNFTPSSNDLRTAGSQVFEALVANENLSDFAESLEMYSFEVKENENRQHEIKRLISKLQKESQKINWENRQAKGAVYSRNKEVTVLINVPEEHLKANPVVIVKLFYVVVNTTWTSKYDVRVLKSEKNINITYFGNVVNNSGEDWTEVVMSLSTAKPSRPGNLPKLPRAVVKLASQVGADANAKRGPELGMRKMLHTSRHLSESSIGIEMDEEDEEVEMQIQEFVQQPETETETTGGSAAFKITRLVNIESDGKPHRQTIGSVDLQPTFSYVASPIVSPHCFLRCHAKNISNLIFMPGPMAVFFNDSFVTTTDMNLVRPTESFSVYLGIDESVKIDYQPEVSKTADGKGGYITKSKSKIQSVSHTINIINTRNEAITCLVYDQLPLARNEGIKIEVLKPDLKKNRGDEKYSINNFNHLEARNKISGGKTWKLEFDYKIEWPKTEEIEFHESFENMRM